MRIRTATLIITAVALLSALVLGTLHFNAISRWAAVREYRSSLISSYRLMQELMMLASQAGQSPKARVMVQWDLTSAKFKTTLNETQPPSEEIAAGLAVLRTEVPDLDSGFKEIFAAGEGNDLQARTIRDELSDRLINRGLVVSAKLNEMDSLSRALAVESEWQVNTLTVITLVVLVLCAVVAWLYLGLGVVGRAGVLAKAARTMQAGDLTTRLKPGRRDELGEAAVAFNRMTERLQSNIETLESKTRQLASANQEIESFSYSVSHDLRAPLRAIDGYSHLLEEDYGARLDDEGRRLLAVVRAESKRMRQLIDDLLTLSRLGRRNMEQAPVDMSGLAEGVLGDLRAGAGGHPWELQMKKLPAASGDEGLLRQVWTNLLSNAVKFTRRNPSARIEVGGRVEGRETVYWVRDNGVGFEMAYVGKLFGVFQRLHSAAEFEGTGVGLAIVQRIVARHGGRAWAEGKVGEGAVFYFALPVINPGHNLKEEGKRDGH